VPKRARSSEPTPTQRQRQSAQQTPHLVIRWAKTQLTTPEKIDYAETLFSRDLQPVAKSIILMSSSSQCRSAE